MKFEIAEAVGLCRTQVFDVARVDRFELLPIVKLAVNDLRGIRIDRREVDVLVSRKANRSIPQNGERLPDHAARAGTDRTSEISLVKRDLSLGRNAGGEKKKRREEQEWRWSLHSASGWFRWDSCCCVGQRPIRFAACPG